MANRYQNDYNDQDYPHYSDRNDRYDSQSERGDFDRNRNEQRNRFGSGRENTQGGSYDYNQSSERSNFSRFGGGRDNGGEQQGFGRTGFQGGRSDNDYGRGRDSSNRSNDDFASSTRAGGGYGSESKRGQRDNRGDYTLYGYDRDQRPVDRSGDYGDRGERASDYSSNYGYSGGSYARSDDDRQSDDGRGGSSRYRGEQGNQSDYRGQQKSGQSYYGQGEGYSGTSEQGYDYQRRSEENRNVNRPRNEQEERGWWERTTDEVASWLGDNEAARRRERDSRENDYSRHQTSGQSGQQTASYRGRGPKNYRRTDDRIKDDINDRLTDYAYLDASDIDVEVSAGEVILTGLVESRYAKRMAEDIAENVSGVTHIENRLRIKNQTQPSESSVQNQAGFSSTNVQDSSGTFGSREDLAANYSNQGLTAASPIGKPATGDLTGSNDSEADLNNASGSANAEADSSAISLATDASGGTESGDMFDKSDVSSTFSSSGVDKLSDSSK